MLREAQRDSLRDMILDHAPNIDARLSLFAAQSQARRVKGEQGVEKFLVTTLSIGLTCGKWPWSMNG